MIVQCPTCRKKYRFKDERLKGRLAVRFKCPECQTVFSVKNPFLAEGAQTIIRTKNPFRVLSPESEKELKEIGEVVTDIPPGRRISLAIIRGDDVGQIFPITKPRTIIGRKGADIVVHDLEISRRHAAIEIHDDAIILRDLNSTNGTYINEKPIREARLENQTEFRIGSTVFMVIISEETSPFDDLVDES